MVPTVEASAQASITKRSSSFKHISIKSGRSKSLREVSPHAPSFNLRFILENKNVALRSLDTTYQDLASAINNGNNTYVLNTSREPSTKPQVHPGAQMNTTLIGLGQVAVAKNNGAITNRQH
jgi:hypothetical protein